MQEKGLDNIQAVRNHDGRADEGEKESVIIMTNAQHQPMRNFTAIDLFCGCGAVTQGLKGIFEVIVAVDNNPYASESYRVNHPEVNFFEEDITQLDISKILQVVGNQNIDLMVVCAPCQPFSSQNQTKNTDERVNLILQACRFAKVLKPRLIFFENVKGIIASKHSSITRKLKIDLKKLGYNHWLGPLSIDAADYGVPQRRKRWIMIVSREKKALPTLPNPTSPEGKRIKVEDAIGDLPPLASGERSDNDPLHFARKHKPIALRRFAHIKKDGGSRFDLPPNLVLDCHKGHKGHPDVYGRMAWNDVAPTLTTGCTDVTRGRFLHPRDDRAITLREATRLQTFPDYYQYDGCPQEIARQIGNAVPVEFIRTIGHAMAESLMESNRRS